MSDDILLEQDGRVLKATFNRTPDNGVSDGMARAFSEAILSAHETSDMVLLRSAGPDFCTGRIRDASAGPPSPEAYSRRPEYDPIFNCYRSIKDAQVPVMGVIEGRCMGFGTAVASVCDVTFASSTATFNIPEVGHNVMPTMVMSALYDRMSRNAILWMAYSADFIDAERALNYGIISQVVAADKLDAEIDRFCGLLTSRPRPAILGLKEYLRSAPRMDDQGALDYARSIHSMINTAAAMKE
ncbi:MAG: enoyl-CoA hydratase/isomerase family protein [Pseudomonadota bacterium]|nr:enoyl-CoA hydratase/isomerase family protein [Pseudomonadota bacterium]